MLNKTGDRRQNVLSVCIWLLEVCEGCFLELRNANIPGQEVGVMKRKVPKKSGMFLPLWPLLLGRGGGCL